MSIFAKRPSMTVCRPLPRFLPLKTCLVLFCLIGLATYAWKYYGVTGPKTQTPLQVTAKVHIHHPTFACQPVWQEIVGHSRPEVREHLKIDQQRSGEVTEVGISLSDLPRETIVPLVNVIASGYVQACRTQWKADTERVCSAAQEELNHRERLVKEVTARLETLRQQRDSAAENAEAALRTPVTIDNPQWTDAARRLTELEERRRVLLFERTPLHPSVQELEMRISDVRREMAAVPAKIAQAAAVDMPQSANRPARSFVASESTEVQQAEQAADNSRNQLLQAKLAVQAALKARNKDFRIDLDPAEEPAPPPTSSRFSPALWGTSLATAMTSILGIGMIYFGASYEPAMSSIGELQAVFHAPIVGVVPAVHPARRTLRSHARRLARYGAIALGMVLLMAVCGALLRV